MKENTKQETQQVSQILRVEPCECPHCSKPVDSKDTEQRGTKFFATYYCQKCDVEWEVVYILTRSCLSQISKRGVQHESNYDGDS